VKAKDSRSSAESGKKENVERRQRQVERKTGGDRSGQPKLREPHGGGEGGRETGGDPNPETAKLGILPGGWGERSKGERARPNTVKEIQKETTEIHCGGGKRGKRKPGSRGPESQRGSGAGSFGGGEEKNGRATGTKGGGRRRKIGRMCGGKNVVSMKWAESQWEGKEADKGRG